MSDTKSPTDVAPRPHNDISITVSQGQVEVTQPTKAETQRTEEDDTMNGTRKSIMMLSLGLATFLAALDSTILSTALPTIASTFACTESEFTWTGTAYVLGRAASGPTWANVSNVFGRKPVLLLANFVFIISSIICALSVNINMLIAGRSIQGVGAGGLIILSNICIADRFSVRERGMWYSIIGTVWAVAGALGPPIGGAFSEYASWRWNFWFNIPVDAFVFVLIFFFLHLHDPKTPLKVGLRKIDWIGSALVITGTCMFLAGLNIGGVASPWDSALVLCLICFGLLLFGAFVLHELRWASKPIMPARLFNTRSNKAALAIPFFHGFVYIADTFFLPQYFQTVLGASPLISGLYLIPLVVTVALFSALTGLFIRKTGLYLPAIWTGMFVMTIGQGLYIAFPAHLDITRIIVFQLVTGFGIGPNLQGPLIALHSGIEKRDIAAGTSFFNFSRNLGTSISIVVAGAIFQNQVAAHSRQLVELLGPNLAQQVGGVNAGGGAVDILNALPSAKQSVVRMVYTESFQVVWIFYTCVSAIGIVLGFCVAKRRLSDKIDEPQAQEGAESKDMKV